LLAADCYRDNFVIGLRKHGIAAHVSAVIRQPEGHMSKHHHHPHEGHSSGTPKGDHFHHNWFFYVAGFFLFLALLAFIFSGNLRFHPSATPPPSKPAPVAK